MNTSHVHSPREARDFIVSDLRARMIGPFENEEILPNRAYDTYHTGFLSPSKTRIDAEEDEQDRGDAEPDSGAAEAIMTLANLSQQSAMGMSFQVDGEFSSTIRLIARWAEYLPVEQKDNSASDASESSLAAAPRVPEGAEGADSVPLTPAVDIPHFKWSRKQCECVLVLSQPRLPPPDRKQDGIELRVIDRPNGDSRIITFSIVNNREQASFPKDNRIYQVELIAESDDGSAAFVARPPSSQVYDDEFWNYELLYRHHKELAVGHGCSVEWDSVDGRRASRIVTTWVPSVEVPKAAANILEGSRYLELDFLSNESAREKVVLSLQSLAVAYEKWISTLEDDAEAAIGEFSATHRDSVRKACQDNIQQCRDAATRIRAGITSLNNDAIWKSFCLANIAMARSMRKSRPDKIPTWRAFQLAFILVCLPSAIEPSHPDRKILDLIWFPTGGGKTEAYLGLAAIVMFYRRLVAKTASEANGTTVLTRYTLRLLTIQQFERAARIICACELIRRDSPKDLWDFPVTCGLFVGNSATPGDLAEARAFLTGEIDEDGSLTTLPLVKCPWCGEQLQRGMQSIDNGRLVTPCPNTKCDFHAELPIAVIDEQIYSYPPTMIVGTIDKFARMAWEPRIRHLFGGNDSGPPSLIIQDELHLISDALGTLAALYETAIDQLCNREGLGPKLIGSTATIRRAEHQCHRLFDRKSAQFPPSGLLADNSFFYQNESVASNPGRLYVGVHAQGRSPKHSLVWAVGTLAQSAMPHSIPDDVVRDPFHTQVLYFNSLRELGGALVLAEDDIPRFLKSIIPDGITPRRRLDHMKELTGQVPSSQIPTMMEHLQRSLYDGNLDYEPLDLVFSTNMISVGIDVDRLGIMVVNGQPKTTSEYIQATSRVGRPPGSAGLVVTLYNWTRPRDRSHYERFTTYHNSFYRYVESVSVTPFSARARDRALHAVLVALSRLLIPQLSEKEWAGHLADNSELQQRVRALALLIAKRAASVDSAEALATRNDLERLVSEWINEAEQHRARLRWSKHPLQRQQAAMLRNPDSNNSSHGLWKTLHSMRDVQAPTPVRILTKRQIDDLS